MSKCASFTRCLRMEWIPVRMTLAFMTMLGLVNVFMVRVNLSVAIVAMVRHNTTNDTTRAAAIQAHCSHYVTQAGGLLVSEDPQEAAGNESRTVSPALLADPKMEGMEEAEQQDGEERLDWNEWVQGLVLGSFFYGYWISQVGGGRLAEMYGTKLVLGLTVLSGGVAACLTPIAAHTHYLALITLRSLQGFMQGAALPCIFPMMVRWIPRFEQAKFVAYVLFCNNISITFTMALCGVVIDYFGWEGAFYVTGSFSFAWCLLWYFCMYDTPEEHPKITQEELDYIIQSKKFCHSCKRDLPSASSSSSSVPWCSVARSLPVWAIMVCEVGNSFGYSVYFSYLPTYIENVVGVPISKNGLLSALPFLARYLGGVLFATTGEYLMAHGWLSVLAVRRIFSSIAMLGPAVTLLAVAYSGCNPVLAICFLCLGFFFNGAITVGVFANKAEVSISYAGTVAGLGNTSANVTSFVVPIVVAAIIRNQQSLEAWQKVFWTCVPMYVVCEAFFLVFASGSRQPWDFTTKKETEEEGLECNDKKEAEFCKVCSVLPQST